MIFKDTAHIFSVISFCVISFSLLLASDLDNASLGMMWEDCEDQRSVAWIRFDYAHQKMQTSIGFLKNNAQHLPLDVLKRCVSYKEYYVYTNPSIPCVDLKFMQESNQDVHYKIGAPLVCDNALPQNINPQSLAEIFIHKNILVYTGAGISAFSIPDFSQVYKNLNWPKLALDTQDRVMCYIQCFFKNEEHALRTMQQFFEKCFFTKPTSAHIALARLVGINRNISLVTENLDFLHEYSGVQPIRLASVEWQELSKDLSAFKDFEYIVVIGLAEDYSGLLNAYKKNNSTGKIIAINAQIPKYLSSEDFIFKGDIQVVLPQLLEGVKELHSC